MAQSPRDGVSMGRSLKNIPAADFPQGYGLRPVDSSESELWQKLTGDIFGYDEPARKMQFEGEKKYFVTGTNGPVGTISTRPGGEDFGSIHWVGVTPEHRGKGVAKAALSAVMKQLGAKYTNAWLSTEKDNDAALNLYKKFGFQEYKPQETKDEDMGETAKTPASPSLYAFGDVGSVREAMFNNVQRAFAERFPLSNQRYTLNLDNLKYRAPKQFKKKDQKRAIMRGQTLGWNLVGDWSLVDNESGKTIDQTKSRLIAQVPYMTERGTFVFNGNEYTVASQMRLRPGIYSRVKDNGIIESHFNVKGGTGRSFRVYMEPDTGVFRANVGQANLKLYPILKAMGIDDRVLNEQWGRDLLQANQAAADPRAVQRAYHKLVRQEPEKEDPQLTKESFGGKYPKADVNYTMDGYFQTCSRCQSFDGLNACQQVQGHIMPSGWCMLWVSSFSKLAQDENANRVRARFIGTIRCDDSNPKKPWVYMQVPKGLAEAAYTSLEEQDIDCEAHYDEPHVTVLKNDEAKKLVDKYGARWKSACGNGRRIPFSLQNAMVDLNPEGWDAMDRVWFLEARSPELRAFRKSLSLGELPEGSDGEQPFHITVAVKPHKEPKKKNKRGGSALDKLFDDKEQRKVKAAFDSLMGLVKQALEGSDELVPDARLEKLAVLPLDVSEPADEVMEGEEPADLIAAQQQAVSDITGSPGTQQKLRQVNQDQKRQKRQSAAPRLLTLENLRDLLPISRVKEAYYLFTGRAHKYEDMVKQAEERNYGDSLRAVFEAMELDGDTTEMTMGKRIDKVSPEVIVDATRKLIGISRREAETDDRDSLAFQRVFGPEDLFAERVSRDAGQASRKLLWRATLKSGVKGIPAGALSPQMRQVLLKSGLAAPLEEVNPLEIFDQLVRVTRMGEGGMPGLDAVPDEARSVQPSHMGVIDPIRAPEGMKIGVDSRMTHRTYKGSDGNVYVDMLNAKTGKPDQVSAVQMAKSIVAFPGEMESDSHEVRAMIKGKKLAYVKREDVDYELPDTSHMFTATSNMVPMVSSIKGGRLLMGAKMATQALPLRNAEAPMVQNKHDGPGNKSFEEIYGERVGAVKAGEPGLVEEITKDSITVRGAGGKKQTYDLYNNFPFNRKTYFHNTPLVRVGQQVEPGQMLAKSNFTNDKGEVASGLNMRVAYVPYRGYNADDAIVISESAAKKLSSEHMYTTKYKEADNFETGKRSFLSLYPGRFDRRQLDTVDDNGVVRVGTKVNYGDPLVLAVSKRKPSGRGMLRARKTLYSDTAEVWDHESPGVVTDVDKTKDGWKVFTKSYSPMNVGDKLSNRYGGKGVVSKIIADDQMPHDKDGSPLEIMLNPLGIVSRVNPAQLVETALGKVAKKTGEKYVMPGFMDESYVDFAQRELNKHGMSDTEDLYDPVSNRKIPKVFTGYTYMMKLHHMAEPKSSGRDIGAYTSEGIPAGGGQDGSKRIGSGEMNALISHGATNVIRDSKLVRGQRNDDFWRALRLGLTPPSPGVPLIYEKFLGYLQGAGINLRKQGDSLQLFALNDQDVDQISSGPITKADTVTGDKFEPVEGGLFDAGLTGGHGGNRWSHIALNEPMPNPVMEEPIRRLLGLTKKRMEDVIAGKEKINGKTGSRALYDALRMIKVDDAIEQNQSLSREKVGAQRDAAIKKLGYLKTMQKMGAKPADLMMNKVPVLPPNFRPITSFNKMMMVSDPNFLYLDLMNANDDLAELKRELGEDEVGDERLRVYKAFKAVTGLGDPVAAKTQEKKVRGLLQHVFGGSPKVGMYQRRVLGAAVDTVGRGVITPNPSLNMDQVGLPESKAWVLYRPFVMRQLVRKGMGAMDAARHVENKTEVAKRSLLDQMASRPVIINRAPVLHRYGMMAAWPMLTKGNTLQIPPIVTPGFNADFDGDAMNYHVPVTRSAVEDAVNKMMPSRNLKAVSDFDVHYFPRQEFLHGLFLASTAKKKGAPKTFISKEQVLAAYKRGELGVGDALQIMKG